jgi:parallel beta-helix repeat (two copies)
MKKMMRRTLAFFITITMLLTIMPTGLCLAQEVSATKIGKVIYLAGDGVGSDSNAGTANAPYRTFAKACENITAGTTLIIYKGVYTASQVNPTWAGTKDNPITIKYDASGKVSEADASLPGPVFTSKANWQDTKEIASADHLIKLEDCTYVNIDGLYITGYTGAGIWTNGGCDHISITNMHIWDIDQPADTDQGTEGILVNGTANSIFKNLDIWDIGQTRRSQADHGLYVGHTVSNCTFSCIKVQDAPGAGIQFYSGENNDISVTNSTIENCVFSGCKFGLILDGIEGTKVINNTFYNSGYEDLYLDWTSKNGIFQNNIFYNDRTELYNDPKYSTANPAIIGYQWSSINTTDKTRTVSGNTFTNNIYEYRGNYPAIGRYSTINSAGTGNDVTEYPIDEFIAMQESDGGNNTFSSFNEGTAEFVGSIDKTGMVKGDEYESKISANAKKLMADALDLTVSSDCIDSGLSTGAPTLDVLGRSRDANTDIGAYEYQKSTTSIAQGIAVCGGRPQFLDIEDHWAEGAIEYIADQKIVSGFPDGTFRPDNQTTRAEFISMVVRMIGLDTTNTTSNFSDVKSSDWYAGTVTAGVKAGLISGLGDRTFAPTKFMTREEAMVILSNVLSYYHIDTKTDASVLDQFSDSNTISSWARAAAINLVGQGMISGDAGKINPQKNITRAEVCMLLNQ